jgi:hypothetical protein
LAQGPGRRGGPPEWAPAVRHDTSRSAPRDARAAGGGHAPGLRGETAAARPAVEPDGFSGSAACSCAYRRAGRHRLRRYRRRQSQFHLQRERRTPDTVGEPGLNQYVQWVNAAFAVFDKATGTKLYGPVGGNTLWTGFGGDCETRNDGDPIVQYDQLADRWIMTQFSLRSGNYLQCVAVSQTEDATGAWYRYAFSYSEFPDYPKLAVWPNAYVITFNMFGVNGSSFTGGRVCAYDRAKMLNGQPATQICQPTSYASLLPADLEGQTLPPAGTPAYVLNRGTNSLNLFKFSPNFANGTSSITDRWPFRSPPILAA